MAPPLLPHDCTHVPINSDEEWVALELLHTIDASSWGSRGRVRQGDPVTTLWRALLPLLQPKGWPRMEETEEQMLEGDKHRGGGGLKDWEEGGTE